MKVLYPMTRSIGIGSLCIRSFVSKGIITSKGNITLTRSIGIGSLRRQPLIRKGIITSNTLYRNR